MSEETNQKQPRLLGGQLTIILPLIGVIAAMHFSHKADKREEREQQRIERKELEAKILKELQTAVKLKEIEGQVKANKDALWGHTTQNHP